jgi:hypothetical protein
MNIFKAVLFAGMVLASQATAQTFVRFHSGVNLSVAPGGFIEKEGNRLCFDSPLK